MDLSILLLLGLGLAIAIPFLGGDDDDDGPNEINGTLGDDPALNGTEGNDFIRGFAGDDTIDAGAGEDIVEAGLGNDTVRGGDDRDIIRGRAGDDELYGDAGSDTLEGGAGDDRMYGGSGTDVLRGGRGDDVMFGGAHAAVVDGELVNDTNPGDIMRGEGGEDTLYNWGRGGLTAGGQNSALDGEVATPELDELVLVTGVGTLEDGEDQTNFFAFANLEDEQTTVATITEFNPEEHKLVLTIDADLDGAVAPDVDFTLTQTEIDGVNGVLVEARFEDDMGNPVDPDFEYETSRAFLRGAILGDLQEEDFAVVLTDNDIPEAAPGEVLTEDDFTLFSPEETLATVKEALPPGFLNTSTPV